MEGNGDQQAPEAAPGGGVGGGPLGGGQAPPQVELLDDILGCQPVQQQHHLLFNIMQDNGDQQAPGAAPGDGGAGGLLGGAPAPPHLDDVGAIGAAVADIAHGSVPMVSVLEGVAAKINTLTTDNRFPIGSPRWRSMFLSFHAVSDAISDAEKAFMYFQVDKNRTSSYSKGAGGRGGASTRGARKGKGGRGGKGKGKNNLNQVSGGKGGKSS